MSAVAKSLTRTRRSKRRRTIRRKSTVNNDSNNDQKIIAMQSQSNLSIRTSNFGNREQSNSPISPVSPPPLIALSPEPPTTTLHITSKSNIPSNVTSIATSKVSKVSKSSNIKTDRIKNKSKSTSKPRTKPKTRTKLMKSPKPKLVTMRMEFNGSQSLPLWLKKQMSELRRESEPKPIQTRNRARRGKNLLGSKTIKFSRNKIKFNDEIIRINDHILFWDGTIEVKGILSRIEQLEKKLFLKVMMDANDPTIFIERTIYFYQINHKERYICLDPDHHNNRNRNRR